jgi:hypothetical protein
MAQTKPGCCTKYITARYELEISFPEGMVICDLCPFCHTENSGTRFRCTLTSEILPFHNKTTGIRCPLGIDQTTTEIEED